jgi:Na+/H+ antiporter NhaD/arsenite permease-like protein
MYKIIIPLAISLVALIFVMYLIFSKKQKPWDQMTEEEKKKKKLMVSGGILVFLAGIVTAVFLGKKEKN